MPGAQFFLFVFFFQPNLQQGIIIIYVPCGPAMFFTLPFWVFCRCEGVGIFIFSVASFLVSLAAYVQSHFLLGLASWCEFRSVGLLVDDPPAKQDKDDQICPLLCHQNLSSSYSYSFF